MRRASIALLLGSVSALAQNTTPSSPVHRPESLSIISAALAAKTCENHSERTVWLYTAEGGWYASDCAKLNASLLGAFTEPELDILLSVEDLRVGLASKEKTK